MSGSPARSGPDRRASYAWFDRITTRWMDNDAYRHVNNVIYYSYIDTAVSRLLVERGGLEIDASPVIGYAVETGCRYFSPISFPDVVHAGVRVARFGHSSVRYEVGLFRDEEDAASAQGHFVHVYVDRATGRPTAIPPRMRAALNDLLRSPEP